MAATGGLVTIKLWDAVHGARERLETSSPLCEHARLLVGNGRDKSACVFVNVCMITHPLIRKLCVEGACLGACFGVDT